MSLSVEFSSLRLIFDLLRLISSHIRLILWHFPVDLVNYWSLSVEFHRHEPLPVWNISVCAYFRLILGLLRLMSKDLLKTSVDFLIGLILGRFRLILNHLWLIFCHFRFNIVKYSSLYVSSFDFRLLPVYFISVCAYFLLIFGRFRLILSNLGPLQVWSS